MTKTVQKISQSEKGNKWLKEENTVAIAGYRPWEYKRSVNSGKRMASLVIRNTVMAIPKGNKRFGNKILEIQVHGHRF